MKDIGLIFTGGTIGSLANGGDISPNDEARYLLLQKYGKNISRFDVSSPLSILSENANIDDVLQMSKVIGEKQHEVATGLKGIIMTHGSDTLANTSAYLSFLLPKLKVPVVLVASNYILTDPNANGVDNFEAAVELIDKWVKPNIYVAYKNPDAEFTSIHLGTRMQEPMPFSDSFYSKKGYRFATYKNGEFEFENTDVNKDLSKIDMFKFSGTPSKKSLYIKPYNGLDYNVYKGANFDYVLHDLYHSGTANTSNYKDDTYETNFLNFVDYCNKLNKPVYLCNINKKDVNYNSTNQMMGKDVRFLYDMLPNVASSKLAIAHNFLPENQIYNYLYTDIAGEFFNDGKEMIKE